MQKQPLLIGIAGQAGSGKNTIGDYLVQHHGFLQMAFADPIKECVNNLFGWDEDQANGELKEEVDPYWGFSPRKAYQLFGTEFGRALSENIWINILQRKRDALRPLRTVVTDVRFQNEANYIRRNGVLLHVFRDNTKAVNNHVSETPINVTPWDSVISNNGTIDELYQSIETVLKFHLISTGEGWR